MQTRSRAAGKRVFGVGVAIGTRRHDPNCAVLFHRE
jgi:hypothetical protein